MVVAAAGCAGPSQYQVTGSGRAPDADGKITVEKVEGVINVIAEHIEPLRLAVGTAGAPLKSRDFR